MSTSIFYKLFFVILNVLFITSCSTSLNKMKETDNKNYSQIKASILKKIIGKNINHNDVVKVFNDFNETPKTTGPYSNGALYYSWKNHGISFLFKSENLVSIFLYAENSDGFSQYKGEIPNALKFSDTRQIIEQKLGHSKISGGNGFIPYWTSYPELGIVITYISLDPKDVNTTIHHIGIE